MDNTLETWDFLIRRIRSKPSFLNNGKPSSALFKDSKGVSVDKDGGRTKEEIIAAEEILHKLYNPGEPEELKQQEKQLKAIISISKNLCEEKKICILDRPLEENKYHALLQKSDSEIELTQGQAKALARNAEILKEYAL